MYEHHKLHDSNCKRETVKMDWLSSDYDLDEDDELLIEASQAYEDSLDHREDKHWIDFEYCF